MGQPDRRLCIDRGPVIRGLTAGETALAREAFGDALDCASIRFLPAPWPFVRAFVPGRWFGREWIVWPRRGDVGRQDAAPLRLKAVLVHELTHVWQAQQGVNLLTGKLRAGDRPASYEYPTGMDCGWGDLNIEQQAMVVEHRFRLLHGGEAPAPAEFYDRVCPLGPRIKT